MAAVHAMDGDGPALTRALVSWYRRARRDLPWRRTADPYRIWVAEVMLQQTTVRAVVPCYRRFLRRFPSLRSLARAAPAGVLAAWSGLGYYRRARSLHAAARTILERHRGRFPRTLEEALALPGIGRYTAGAVLSIAFNRKTPVLDGNVARVLSRLTLLRGDPRRARNQKRLWSLAARLVGASRAPGDLNQALMELGATICTPASPACPRCPLKKCCAARAAGAQDRVPPPRRRRPPVRVRTALAVVSRGGRLLMRRRDGTGLMEGLWEFPAMRRGPARDGAADDGLRVEATARLGTLAHAITYRRLQIEVVRARLIAEPRAGTYRWVTPAQARRLPVSSIVPKVLDRLR